MTFTWKEFPIIFITDSGTYDKSSFDNVFEKGWTNYVTACEKPTQILICRVFFWNKPVPAKVTVLLSAEWSMCSRGVLPRPWFMLKRSLGGWGGEGGPLRRSRAVSALDRLVWRSAQNLSSAFATGPIQAHSAPPRAKPLSVSRLFVVRTSLYICNVYWRPESAFVYIGIFWFYGLYIIYWCLSYQKLKLLRV